MFSTSLQTKIRQPPEMPSTDGIDYKRAASWANVPLSTVLADDKGIL
jgi:hypothetical protein